MRGSLLVRGEEGIRSSGSTRSSRSADSMDVILNAVRKIKVNNNLNVLNVCEFPENGDAWEGDDGIQVAVVAAVTANRIGNRKT